MKTTVGVIVGLALLLLASVADEENILFPDAIELGSSDGRKIKAHIFRFNDGGVDIVVGGENHYYVKWKKFDKATTSLLESMRKKNIAAIQAAKEAEDARIQAEKDAEDARQKLEIEYDEVDEEYIIAPENWGRLRFYPVIKLGKGQEPKIYVVAKWVGGGWLFIESVTVLVKAKGKDHRASLKLEKLQSDILEDGVREIYAAREDAAMHDALRAAAEPESSGTIRIRGWRASDDIAINKKFKHACRDIIALQREILKTKGWFEAHKKNKGVFDDTK